MEQPMLSVAPRNGSAAKATPNLLPCRIHHDGEVGETKPYWIPSTNGGMQFVIAARLLLLCWKNKTKKD